MRGLHFILFIGNLVNLQVIFPSWNRCDCLDIHEDLCNKYPHCSWQNNTCSSIQCNSKQKVDCNQENTDFKCIYDDGVKKCLNNTLPCNVFNSDKCQKAYLSNQNCHFHTYGYCEDFQCTDSKICDIQKCTLKSDQCQNPSPQIDCKKLSKQDCGGTSLGNGTFCLLDENGDCQSFTYKSDCSVFNTLISQCPTYCQIEGEQCRQKQCSDFNETTTCTYTFNPSNSSIQSCVWLDNVNCTEVSSTNQFNSETCMKNTNYNYYWTSDSECQICEDFIDIPSNFYHNISKEWNQEDESNSMKLMLLMNIFILYY